MKHQCQNKAGNQKINKKLRFLLGLSLLFFPTYQQAQPGIWTWMQGSNSTNASGVYGAQGVPSSNVTPPGLTSPADWKDLSGNFWMYGGILPSGYHGDLWRFNPITAQWVWYKGPGIPNQWPSHGIQGVSTPGNFPGARGNAGATWVDNIGNLWMFGGYGYDINGTLGPLNDLWKFNISSGQWTWVTGSTSSNSPGNYGTILLPSLSNQPPARFETSASWTADDGTLWLFGGGNNSIVFNDMWKFDPATSLWTWMHGTPGMQVSPVFGPLGVASPLFTPGSRKCYSQWKDNCGKLWLFGGKFPTQGDANDLWRFDVASNQWTWMGGPQIANAGGAAGLNCQSNIGFYPCSRWSNGASCGDLTGKFWQFGGRDYSTVASWNDLWAFNPYNSQFSCVKGVASGISPTNYGSFQVPASANMPPERYGSVAWSDLAGNLWVFGGSNFRNDLWRFSPSPGCPNWNSTTDAGFTVDVQAGCPPLSVAFTNTSTGSNSFAWHFNDGTTSNTANPNHTFTQPGTYLVTLVATDSNNCAQIASFDTIYITVVPTLSVNLGPDVSTCSNDLMPLVAGTPGFTYSWNTGATTSSILPTTSGDYSVTVSGGSCFTFDSIQVTVVPAPQINLGNDTAVCGSGSVLLNANAGGINTGFAFLWNTNENSPFIIAANSGTYSCLVTNSICSESDSIDIVFYREPDLGPDTSVCEGTIVLLDAFPGSGNFLWNTGDTLSSIQVSSAGVYSVSVFYPGCNFSDTILVNFNSVPVVELGHDTTLCELIGFPLDAGNPGSNYHWANNQTTQTFDVIESGTYFVTVTLGNCSTVDSIRINYASSPDLGPDTSSCPGIPFKLDAGHADSWIWNTGSPYQFILVTGTGVYSVTTQTATCLFADTVSITFKSLPFVEFGPDTIICPGQSLHLDANMSGLNNGSTFVWNHGQNNSSIEVKSEGVYGVTVTFDGCISSDSIGMSFETMPDMGNEISLCEVDPLILQPAFEGIAYEWSTGSTHSWIQAEDPGFYWVNVTSQRCIHSDTVEVVGDHGNGIIFVPNSFTPNGDGINDEFLAFGSQFLSFKMTIYSRWGQPVFISNDPTRGWNGTMQGESAQEGNYAFLIQYQSPCSGTRILEHAGSLSLVR